MGGDQTLLGFFFNAPSCNYCSTNNLKRQELYNHILESDEKCTICDKVCPTQSSYENHMKAIHLKPCS